MYTKNFGKGEAPLNREDLQREMLLAQFQKKRSLRQKYLQGDREEAGGPLLELMMKNMLLLSIRERADIFGLLRRLEQTGDPYDGMPLHWVMDCLQEICQALDCGAYELFIEDREKQQRVIRRLLEALSSCLSWENVTLDKAGNGGFVLPGADYALRMAERPTATLIFERACGPQGCRYTLTMTAMSSRVFPQKTLLWQEDRGDLQSFVDQVLSAENSLPPEGKAELDALRKQTMALAETLEDLGEILDALGEGSQLTILLGKEAQKLHALREREKALYVALDAGGKESTMGQRLREATILLGAAANKLEKLPGSREEQEMGLGEIVFMLKNAAELM